MDWAGSKMGTADSQWDLSPGGGWLGEVPPARWRSGPTSGGPSGNGRALGPPSQTLGSMPRSGSSAPIPLPLEPQSLTRREAQELWEAGRTHGHTWIQASASGAGSQLGWCGRPQPVALCGNGPRDGAGGLWTTQPGFALTHQPPPVGPPWAFAMLCCSLKTHCGLRAPSAWPVGLRHTVPGGCTGLQRRSRCLGSAAGAPRPLPEAFLTAPRPLQQQPSVRLRGDCSPVGPGSQGVEGVTGVSPRALPLLWASSVTTRDRATRPRRPEVVGGLWDHAGVSLWHPTPSELPRGCSGPRGKVRDQSRGGPRQLS